MRRINRQIEARIAEVRAKREKGLSPYQRHAVGIFESWGWQLTDGRPEFRQAGVYNPETKETIYIPYKI